MKYGPYAKSDFDTLTIREALGIAGISRPTLYAWLAKDYFKAERQVNGYVLIDKESFMNYIKDLKKHRNSRKGDTL